MYLRVTWRVIFCWKFCAWSVFSNVKCSIVLNVTIIFTVAWIEKLFVCVTLVSLWISWGDHCFDIVYRMENQLAGQVEEGTSHRQTVFVHKGACNRSSDWLWRELMTVGIRLGHLSGGLGEPRGWTGILWRMGTCRLRPRDQTHRWGSFTATLPASHAHNTISSNWKITSMLKLTFS